MKAAKLKKYLESNAERLDNLEFYSIMNCLSEHDIEDLYFDYGFEGMVLKYIEKYNHEHKRNYTKVVSDLVNKFKITSVTQRKVLRDTLVNIVVDLNSKVQKLIFHLLSSSDHIIENRRAAQISHLIWCEKVKQEVIELYQKTNDKFIAIELIENLDQEDISQFFEVLWNDTLRNSEKQKLIEKSNLNQFEIERYIKEKDLKFYLLYLVKNKVNLDEVYKLYNEVDYEDRTYIKWITGKMKCGKLLLQLIELDKNLKESWD